MKKRIFIGALLTVFAVAVVAQQDPAKPANPGFIKLDKNKDNFLSRAEAEGDKDLHAIFTKADLNKDGKLDEDEFLKGVSTDQREKAAQYAEDSA